MKRDFEALVVIKSAEKSERDDFYLLHIKHEYFVNRYNIIFHVEDASILAHVYNWELTPFVDSLIRDLPKNSIIFPASKSDYENFISKSFEVKDIPCFIVEIDKREIDITYSYGKSIKYSLGDWYDIAAIISALDSIIHYDCVVINDICPCAECIVRTMCLKEAPDYGFDDFFFFVDPLNITPIFDKVRLVARNPCPDFYDWKKERFKNLWDNLPDDIKELESKNYKEMLLKNSDKN